MNAVLLSDLLKATRGFAKDNNHIPETINHIRFDSRTLEPNEVFWALRGVHHDGHNYVESAIQNGASACVVDHAFLKQNSISQTRLIVVDDTLAALQRFAGWYRSQQDITAIGITGSYGKTTARELISSVLTRKAPSLQNESNHNNEFGVPFTLLKLTHQTKFLIMEMGAAHPGDIAPLAEITSPEIGLITGIGPAHLDGFGSVKQILETKGDLIAALPQGGLAILPGDYEWSEQLKQRANCRVLTIGLGAGNTYRANHIESSRNRLNFQVNNTTYHLKVAGQHHVSAALAAVAIGTELGFTTEDIQHGFDSFQPVAGRSQLVQDHPWTVIDDTYNANPASCEASCKTLADWNTNGRRFLVLGDMLELGPDSQTYHETLGRKAAKYKLDFVFTYGQNAKHIVTGIHSHNRPQNVARQFDTLCDLIAELRNLLQPQDVILVKGSRGMQMERVVQAIITASNVEQIHSTCHGSMSRAS